MPAPRLPRPGWTIVQPEDQKSKPRACRLAVPCETWSEYLDYVLGILGRQAMRVRDIHSIARVVSLLLFRCLPLLAPDPCPRASGASPSPALASLVDQPPHSVLRPGTKLQVHRRLSGGGHLTCLQRGLCKYSARFVSFGNYPKRDPFLHIFFGPPALPATSNTRVSNPSTR